MMAMSAVPESPVTSGQPLFTKGLTAAAPAPFVASASERRSSSGISSSTLPLVAVFAPPWPRHKQHNSVQSCRKRFPSALVIHKTDRPPVFPTGGLRMRTTVCSAAYGSSNGNGRPGRGFQNSGGGYSPRPLTEDLNITKEQTNDSSRSSDRGNELGEAGEGHDRLIRGSRIGSRSQEAQEKKSSSISSSSAIEKNQQGEDPYRIMENGQKVYLDELDVVTLLEPPPFLRPLKTLYYNHAAFLWKKIGDIPEERRHRLLDLLLPRHISKMWEMSNLRYEDPDVSAELPEDVLCISSEPSKSVLWDGRATHVPWYLSPFSRFQKVFFVGNDEKTYGRVILGGSFFRPVTDRLAPLYFQVLQVDSVMATEERCDFALDYGEGQLHLRDTIPAGFAQPGNHLPPFNDNSCDYLRAVGPGVIVGQTWIEGRTLQQPPRKWLGEFILVRRYQ